MAVDPAGAMLDQARAKPGSGKVHGVQADALWLDLGARFALMAMTGQAFRVFLTDAGRALCLTSTARHLDGGGRFIFDSRNPARHEWDEWRPAQSRRRSHDPAPGAVEAWNDVVGAAKARVATHETACEASGGQVFRAESRIGFTGRDGVAAVIGAAGLAASRWYGDWTRSACRDDSPEFIRYGRLA